MKTEMKMIAAILAVLAVALGGVYALDDAQADDEVPATAAIWPGPAPEPASDYTDYNFLDWTTPADWVVTPEGVVYWIQDDLVTVLGETLPNGTTTGTHAVFFGKDETFRVMAVGPAAADITSIDADDLDVRIQFFNIRGGDQIGGDIKDLEICLENSEVIETEYGTLYLTGMKMKLGAFLQSNASDIQTKTLYVPVLLKKTSISCDIEFEYKYNRLYQSPIAELNDDNSKATPLSSTTPENPVPYIPEPCFTMEYLADYLPEGVEIPADTKWNYEGDVVKIYTNKYEAMAALWSCAKDDQGNYVDEEGNIVTLADFLVPYSIKVTPADSNVITGTINITWWIMPLTLDDIEFNIKDPYYDYDQEVLPQITMTWYEPIDGPNTVDGVPKARNILPQYVDYDLEFIMPENYPYDMPVTLVPVYKQAVDADGNPQFTNAVDEFGNVIYEQAKDENGNPVWENEQKQSVDEYGRLKYSQELTDANDYFVPVGESDWYQAADEAEYDAKMAEYTLSGGVREGVITPAYDTTSDPVMETVYEKKYQPKLDENNKPVYEQAVDAAGNPLFRQWRYEDGSFAYYQLIDDKGKYVYDADGNPKYDMNAPVMVPVMVPSYELVDSDVPAQVAKMVPKQVPVYELDENGNPVPEQRATGKFEQAVDADGNLMYEQKKYENGDLVWEQKVSNKGNPVWVTENGKPKLDENGDKIPEYDVGTYDEATQTWSGGSPVYDLTKPIYDQNKPIMEDVFEEVPATFTATQVGYPYQDRVFYYGVHIVCDTGFYEFDTADYVPAVDPVTGEPVYAQAVDEDGNLVTMTTTDSDGNFITIPVSSDVMLSSYDIAVIDEEDNESYYLTYVGEPYDAERFLWKILPIPVENKWIDFDTMEITVPTEATQYWNYVDEEGNPISEPAEDYTIVPMHNEPYKWPFAGQYKVYTEGPMAYLEFPEGSNFIKEDGLSFKNIAIGGWLNVDQIEVVDTLVENDVYALKNAVHLFAMNMSPLKPFMSDDFNITVLDGDGDLIIYQDKIIRASLDSDMYAITVTGNPERGFYGSLFGFFTIDREASEADTSVFTTVADNDYRNAVKITGYTGDATEIVIPDYIDGKRVTSIGAKAFYGNKDITSVVFGDNVRKIHDKAFAQCTNLKTIEFSDSVKVIGKYAFYNDKALTSVAFGHGLKAVRDNAFSVDFLLLGYDFKRGMMELPPNVDFSENGIYVYANYKEGNAAKYLAEYLVGNTFIFNNTKGALELFPPISMSFDTPKVPAVFDERESESPLKGN